MKHVLSIPHSEVATLRDWARRTSPKRSLRKLSRRRAYELGFDDGFAEGLAVASQNLLRLIKTFPD